MEKRCVVVIARFAEKQLKRVPKYIKVALLVWAESVEEDGISSVRRLPGYHDEPLHGDRAGQRSIRLSRSYRAIYLESDDGSITIVNVTEVHKHDY